LSCYRHLHRANYFTDRLLLENLVEHNQGNFPDFLLREEFSGGFEERTSEKPIDRKNLAVLAEKVLRELKYGKQSSHYQVAKKALKQLITLSSSL